MPKSSTSWTTRVVALSSKTSIILRRRAPSAENGTSVDGCTPVASAASPSPEMWSAAVIFWLSVNSVRLFRVVVYPTRFIGFILQSILPPGRQFARTQRMQLGVRSEKPRLSKPGSVTDSIQPDDEAICLVVLFSETIALVMWPFMSLLSITRLYPPTLSQLLSVCTSSAHEPPLFAACQFSYESGPFS